MQTSKYRRLPTYHSHNQKKKYTQFEQMPVVSVKTVTTLPMVVVSDEEPESKVQPPKSNKQQFRYVLLSLILAAGLSLWLMQDSVENYYQQTYHKNSILSKLKQYSWWQAGAKAALVLNSGISWLNQNITSANHNVTTSFNQHVADAEKNKTTITQKPQLTVQQNLQQTAKQDSIKSAFTLGAEDEVFFAGDSLMQGVAPHIQKWLSEGYGIKSINLAKQSTGLTYPGFFNWPETIARTLNDNPRIKIMVIFLGPNDPWDIPDPHNGTRFISFASARWESMYRSRIQTIMDTARQHQVTVLWLTPPDMRRHKLNQQMVYLRQLTTDEVMRNHGFVVDTRAMLGSNGDEYNDTLMQPNGKKIKTRSADGIHFTISGQKIIARDIFNRFILPAQPNKNDYSNVH